MGALGVAETEVLEVMKAMEVFSLLTFRSYRLKPRITPQTSGVFELQNVALPPSEVYWISSTLPATLRSNVARRTPKHESGCRTYPGLYFPTEGRDRTIDVTEETSEGS